MRTYILALTKYGITATVIGFTVLAFFLLTRKETKSHETIRVLTLVQNAMILLFQLLSFFTLYVALEDASYMLFGLFVMVIFFVIFYLYQTLYEHANMPLFNDMCMLLSVGLVIQARLSFSNATHQLAIAAIGLVIAFVLPKFRKYFSLLKKPKYWYGILSVGVLAGVMLLGSTTLGANLTYTIAGVTFQPSEFMKIVFLLFLASTLEDCRDFKQFCIITVFAAAHVLCLIGSTDLGSGLIYYMIFMFVAFLATGQWIILAGGTGLLAGGAVACYYLFDHIQQRVQAFLDPWSLIDSIGYQIAQSLFAISAGGLWGTGLGQGTPEDIPFAESDFIFAAVCEELGQIIGVCVILICLNCFFVMLNLAGSFADRFYRLLAYGTAIAYVFQTFLTIGGEVKFIPLTGVTLPFISYGGSSILTTLIMFTLIEIMCILRGEKIDEVRRRQEQRREETRTQRAHPSGGRIPEGQRFIPAASQQRIGSAQGDVQRRRASTGARVRSSYYEEDYDRARRQAAGAEYRSRPEGDDIYSEYDRRTRRAAAYEHDGRTGSMAYAARGSSRAGTGSMRSASDGDDSYWDDNDE